MARKPRIHIPGAFYHVMLRGRGGMPVFYGQDSIQYFERLLSEGVSRYGHRIHAYCWMNNHVHMVIEAGDIPISKAIQNLSFRYTRYVNQTQNRHGSLFQGRYKAIWIHPDIFLLDLIRYVHLNPVRAGILKSPDQYRYSSHYAYLGRVATPWLTCSHALGQFDDDIYNARKVYAEFVLQGICEVSRIDFHREPSVSEVPEYMMPVQSDPPNQTVVGLNVLVQAACETFRMKTEKLFSTGRERMPARVRSIITLLYIESGGVMSEAALFFQRDLSTLSRQVTRLREKLKADSETREEIREIRSKITQD